MTQELGPRQRELVAVLRSGTYKQGSGSLRKSDDRFCCLGIACDISKLGRWSSDWVAGLPIDYITQDESRNGGLPNAICEYFGFTHLAGDPSGPLAHLNDEGKTFVEIADYTEAEASNLFLESK